MDVTLPLRKYLEPKIDSLATEWNVSTEEVMNRLLTLGEFFAASYQAGYEVYRRPSPDGEMSRVLFHDVSTED